MPDEFGNWEIVEIADLARHPRNYRHHPDEQIAHIMGMIKRYGIYRNIVVARDLTILAGHGVVTAAQRLGMTRIPVIRLDVHPGDPDGLKVLTGDNEMARLAEVDDRALTDMLREINDIDPSGLLGTGFDEVMLAGLTLITRPVEEISDFDAAAHWVGMPEFEWTPNPLKVIVSLRSEADRLEFFRLLGIEPTDKTKSVWWPPKERENPAALLFEG